jgi:acetyl-CoA synthetase
MCTRRVVYHAFSGRNALELKPGTIYWCTADPGWVTGTSYGIIAPLVNRVTMIVDEAEFDLERWYEHRAREGRGLVHRAHGDPHDDARGRGRGRALRFLVADLPGQRRRAAEPRGRGLERTRSSGALPRQLVADRNRRHHDRQHPAWTSSPAPWASRCRGSRPGSSTAKTARRARELQADGEIGELALRPGWPSMMRAYLHEEARYDKCFATAGTSPATSRCATADGYFWFVGRADDLIKISGHLIGPFEVESALIEHEAVAEAGVIGVPDETAGEVVKAYVVAQSRVRSRTEELERAIRGHARKKLGPAVAPREIVFRKTLPKTRSGKIMRRLLKARELGLPEGDISTLETTRHDRDRQDRASRPCPCAGPAQGHDPHPPVRGQMRRALHPAEDPRLPASL